jgi:hypothetical protein
MRAWAHVLNYVGVWDKITPPMAAIQDAAVRRLLSGEDGASVVADLRPLYTVQSLGTVVCHVKRRVLEEGYKWPLFETSKEEALAPLRAFAHEAGVAEFLEADLLAQVTQQRVHRSHRTWSAAAEAALAALRLLPPSMAAFRISEEETVEIKAQKGAALEKRLQNVLVVSEAGRLLERMDALLRGATAADPYCYLVGALLLASGRREIEIMNACSGRSRFQRHDATSVFFEGQAKKPTETAGYVVPLLCDSAVFLDALEVLRKKRGDVSALDNAQLKRKMNGGLTSMHVRRTFPSLPDGAHFHTLRSVYFHFVFTLYSHTCSYIELGRRLLGHGKREESHAYTAVRLDGVDRLKGSMGPLVVASHQGDSL